MAKKRNLLPAILIAGASILPAASANAATVSGTVAPQTIESDTELTLNGATIDARGQAKTPAIDIKPGATLTLTLEGDNYIYGGTCAAGIHVSPAYDSQTDNPDTYYIDDTYNADNSAKLIIKGSGNLTVLGGRAHNEEETAFQCASGAGIGGNGDYSEWDGRGNITDGVYDWYFGPDFGEITVDEGFTGNLNITAGPSTNNMQFNNNETSYYGAAGLGSGGMVMTKWSPNFHDKINGKINIHGGNITASGDTTIFLQDGNREMAPGAGAGIGVGGGRSANNPDQSYNNVEINITSGNITANGGSYAAGIGGGSNQNSGFINISGGTIVATGGATPNDQRDSSKPEIHVPAGAGIGAGDNGSAQIINITGGDITAISQYGSAGIGGGYDGVNMATAIYDDSDDWGYPVPSEDIQINISGANTKVVAIGGDSYDDYDEHGDRVKSGAGIGTGAAYPRTNGWYSSYYDINITDRANVTAIGGSYANGIGYGGTYFIRNDNFSDHIGHEYGTSVTIDDTVALFAASGSSNVAALPQINDNDSYRNITPLSYQSDTLYMVQHDSSNTFALKQIPTDQDGTDATFALSGTTMTVSVDGEEATTHDTSSYYNPGSSFALISGKKPTVEICRITVEHRDVDTDEKIVDDDANSDSAVCGRNPFTVEISNDALAKNYKFDHAIDSSSNEYNESDFPLNTLNEDGDRVFTIYYKAVKEDEPKDTPEESTDEPEEVPTEEEAKDEFTEAPNTLDNIIVMVGILGIAVVGTIISAILIKRQIRK